MMRVIAVVEAPSILGLNPTGVQEMPTALKAAGLLTALNAQHSGRVEQGAAYDATRDPETHLLNGSAIHDYALRLADVVGGVIDAGKLPLVIGGDCSILLGNLLALRRRGTYGLLFLDGHADFYAPERSASGEVADMDLAIAMGRGADVLSNIDGLKPLVREENVVLFGYRDAEEAQRDGSENPKQTAMHCFDLLTVRSMGARQALEAGLAQLSPDLEGIWLHLDADVLDDAVMPAVDYRQPDGLHLDELSDVLRLALSSGRIFGMEITIFNPIMDTTGEVTRRFVDCLIEGFTF